MKTETFREILRPTEGLRMTVWFIDASVIEADILVACSR